MERDLLSRVEERMQGFGQRLDAEAGRLRSAMEEALAPRRDAFGRFGERLEILDQRFTAEVSRLTRAGEEGRAAERSALSRFEDRLQALDQQLRAEAAKLASEAEEARATGRDLRGRLEQFESLGQRLRADIQAAEREVLGRVDERFEDRDQRLSAEARAVAHDLVARLEERLESLAERLNVELSPDVFVRLDARLEGLDRRLTAEVDRRLNAEIPGLRAALDEAQEALVAEARLREEAQRRQAAAIQDVERVAAGRHEAHAAAVAERLSQLEAADAFVRTAMAQGAEDAASVRQAVDSQSSLRGGVEQVQHLRVALGRLEAAVAEEAQASAASLRQALEPVHTLRQTVEGLQAMALDDAQAARTRDEGLGARIEEIAAWRPGVDQALASCAQARNDAARSASDLGDRLVAEEYARKEAIQALRNQYSTAHEEAMAALTVELTAQQREAEAAAAETRASQLAEVREWARLLVERAGITLTQQVDQRLSDSRKECQEHTVAVATLLRQEVDVNLTQSLTEVEIKVRKASELLIKAEREEHDKRGRSSTEAVQAAMQAHHEFVEALGRELQSLSDRVSEGLRERDREGAAVGRRLFYVEDDMCKVRDHLPILFARPESFAGTRGCTCQCPGLA